ncbi:MAG: hypothetical protein NUV46_00785 [Nanoarchaeota archaeon]|nr:hypothetical protein [Nanoarchaeota archaeon]
MKKKSTKKLKKIGKDPLVKEYFRKQKKLTKGTLKKVAKRVEKKINDALS